MTEKNQVIPATENVLVAQIAVALAITQSVERNVLMHSDQSPEELAERLAKIYNLAFITIINRTT